MPLPLAVILKKMRATKIILYLLIFSIVIIIAVYDMVTYEFTEQLTAAEIVYRKLLIPLILIAIILSILIIRYGYQKGKLLRSRIIDYFKAIGLFIIGTCGFGLLTFALFQGAIITSNRVFGEQKDIFINGTITKFSEVHNRKNVHYYIKVKDSQIDRIISLRVKDIYKVGDDFKMNMKIGCLDLLYKK
jgi:hypothetical protein